MDRDAELFQALADLTRLRLLNLLTQVGEICVCELADAMQIAQHNISRHLHVLLDAGLVRDRRHGKWVYFRITEELEPFERLVVRAVEQLREGREDFRRDEARAARRLKLRRGGICCIGLVAGIDAASSGRRRLGSARG